MIHETLIVDGAHTSRRKIVLKRQFASLTMLTLALASGTFAQTSEISILSLSPTNVAQGQRLDLALRIRNTGSSTWSPIDPVACHSIFEPSAYGTCRPYPLGSGNYGIRLEAHFLDSPDPVNTYWFTDLTFPREIAPGETIDLQEYFFATLPPGRYRLAVITLRHWLYAFTSRVLHSPADSLALGATADFVVTELVPVSIDIRPGTFPNAINLGSNGKVPVAILSTPAFNANTVDPLSVTLAGSAVALKGNGTPMASSEDVNSDGLADLVVHILVNALQLTNADTEAVLEGFTLDRARRIRGTDTIRVVP
jgi:hypothetical protein